VKNRSTRLTFILRVATAVSSGDGAGAVLTGGASGEGASWALAAADNPDKTRTATPKLRLTLGRVLMLVT